MVKKRNINHKTLINFINEYRKEEYIPVKLLCCNKLLCKDCFEEYIKTSNSIICPFCKKDHEKEEKDYINYYYDLSDDIDVSKWTNWWIDHLDIF